MFRQAAAIRLKVKRRKDITSAEFLSGFTKDSRLPPCVTLILYYGEDWDGARDFILDFTDIPQELRDKVNDYHIHICEVRKFQNTNIFQSVYHNITQYCIYTLPSSHSYINCILLFYKFLNYSGFRITLPD